MKPFEILELVKTASPDDIKDKYKMLAKVYHPDTGGGADKFIEITKAYKAALAISENTNCPHCTGGDYTEVHGFSSIQVRCKVCSGTGKKYNKKG